MFDRWKKTHKAVYEVESENLAVPEVHIREDDTAAHDTKQAERGADAGSSAGIRGNYRLGIAWEPRQGDCRD